MQHKQNLKKKKKPLTTKYLISLKKHLFTLKIRPVTGKGNLFLDNLHLFQEKSRRKQKNLQFLLVISNKKCLFQVLCFNLSVMTLYGDKEDEVFLIRF